MNSISAIISIFLLILIGSTFVFIVKKLKNKPKYVCELCGNSKYPSYGIRAFLWNFLVFFSLTILLICGLIGSLSIMNAISTNYYSPQSFFSVGGLWSEPLNVFSNYEKDLHLELKEISLNLTKGCDSDYGRALLIYQYLVSTFEYEEGSNLHPMQIWEEKSGDCDEISYLYISLLKTLDIDASMQCELQGGLGHCYSIVKLENKLILVDVVQERWIEYNDK